MKSNVSSSTSAAWTAAALMLLSSACASLPQPLQGQATPITPVQAREANQSGVEVRWGGRIVETRPGADETCFDMIGSPLESSGRPARMSDVGYGRFIACKAGFYDPAVFTKNREVTVMGKLVGFENRKIGQYDYRQPKVAADVVYLWPQARPVDSRYPMHRPWPWWTWDWGPGWWGPYPGWWW